MYSSPIFGSQGLQNSIPIGNPPRNEEKNQCTCVKVKFYKMLPFCRDSEARRMSCTIPVAGLKIEINAGTS